MLFQPDVCELLFRTPETNNVKESSLFEDFIEELRYEASRREIELYTSESPKDAAKHLISKAA